MYASSLIAGIRAGRGAEIRVNNIYVVMNRGDAAGGSADNRVKNVFEVTNRGDPRRYACA